MKMRPRTFSKKPSVPWGTGKQAPLRGCETLLDIWPLLTDSYEPGSKSDGRRKNSPSFKRGSVKSANCINGKEPKFYLLGGLSAKEKPFQCRSENFVSRTVILTFQC